MCCQMTESHTPVEQIQPTLAVLSDLSIPEMWHSIQHLESLTASCISCRLLQVRTLLLLLLFNSKSTKTTT